MVDLLCIPLLQSGGTARILAILGLFILALGLGFFWHQWKMVRAYRGFPSKRKDIEWIFWILFGRYLKDVPFTSLMFTIIMQSLDKFRKEGLCVLWFLKPNVFVFKSEFIKDLINEDALADRASPFEINKLIFGNGILGSKHEEWKAQRKLINPAFSTGVLKNKMLNINKYALQLVEKCETRVGKPVGDAEELLKFCAFQNMADFVLGLELDNERHVSLAKRFIKLVDIGGALFIERLFRPWLHWDFLLPFFRFGKKYLKFIHDSNLLAHEIREELKKKFSEKEQRNEDSKVVSSCGDFLLSLELQHHDFTEKDTRDHLVGLSAAGYDTMYITMLFCLYTLGQNPEVQEKAYNEVMSIVPEGDVTYEDLAQLKYLECVIKETLRIYSTLPIFSRKTRKDIQCGKYVIPKGTEVVFHIAMLHKDPNVFPEPEKFNPERFLSGSELRPWMFIPFSEGYRNCIGKRFAMMQLKVQLAHVLRRIRITSLDKIRESDLQWITLLKPKPFRLLFENRRRKCQSHEK